MVNHAEASRLNIERMKQIYQQLSCYRGLGKDASVELLQSAPGWRREALIPGLSLSSGLLATVPSNSNGNRNGNETGFPVEASHDPSPPSGKHQEAPQPPRVHASAAVSDREASCLAGYQMPVHAQGNWQSGVMMYRQDPQTGMGAHQQGESLTSVLTAELRFGMFVTFERL